MDIITSKDNPKVKYLASLHDNKTSRITKAVIVEGVRSCEDALKWNVKPLKAVADEKHAAWAQDVSDKNNCECIILSEACFRKISKTVNPQGVALVIGRDDSSGEIGLRGEDKDIFLCLEDIQDPGNLGTMIRIADAFDFNAVLVTRNTVDAYNDKVIRSSMGSIWKVPVIEFENSEMMIDKLHKINVKTIAAELHGDDLGKAGIDLPAAYFIGNEGAGLKPETIDKCDIKIKLRMDGKAESLNAASAASILGFYLQGLRG